MGYGSVGALVSAAGHSIVVGSGVSGRKRTRTQNDASNSGPAKALSGCTPGGERRGARGRVRQNREVPTPGWRQAAGGRPRPTGRGQHENSDGEGGKETRLTRETTT